MSKNKRNIGWQKYEDQLENQMSSPLMNTILTGFTKNLTKSDNEYEQEMEYEDEDEGTSLMLPMTQQLIEDISMLSNFECWVGHTNFDITPKVRNALDTIEGIELLKVCSRYRFFIGVGKMFDFKEVRNKIENNLTIERSD